MAVAIADPAPRVRLEAIQALCNVPSAQAVAIGMRALDQSTDPFIDFALKKLAILHKAQWQPEFAAGRLTFDGNARHAAFALKAIGGEAVPILVGLVEKGQVPQENLTGILQLVALMGNPSDQALALRQLLAPGTRPRPTRHAFWRRWRKRRGNVMFAPTVGWTALPCFSRTATRALAAQL